MRDQEDRDDLDILEIEDDHDENETDHLSQEEIDKIIPDQDLYIASHVTTAKKSTKNHYIDNDKFREELTKVYHEIQEAKKTDPNYRPRLNNFIGSCFLKIAERMSRRGNFGGYPYRDEMVCEAVETCIRRVGNYDPNKSNNAFGYFSFIIWRSFVHRISYEKKVLYKHLKATMNAVAAHDTYDGEDKALMFEGLDLDFANDYIRDYEAKIERARQKARDKNKPAEEVDLPQEDAKDISQMDVLEFLAGDKK